MKGKIIKVLAVTVLFFYAWTFMGVCDWVYAAEKLVKESGGNPAKAGQGPKGKSAAEKLEQVLNQLEQDLGGPSPAAPSMAAPAGAADLKALKAKAKSKLGEIQKLDKELRKEFLQTEKKLKAARLPQEILERHYKFVRHYEDNLKELKVNLTALDRAKDSRESDEAAGKLKAHLKRVKPPSRHVPLDPNKLPHRAAEPVYRAPRMNKEDFEKGLGKQKAALPIIEDSDEWRVASDELNTKDSGELRVASLEPNTVTDAGMPLLSTLNPQLSTPLYAAANPPSPEDLAETIEVQFTPEIRAKAQELGNKPVAIYEWVRNNVEFVPTYGSIQGAQMTLLTKQGNAFDIASLLIALLRVSNLPARYVYGTIELPIEKVMNWTGGFIDAKSALDLIASGGIPVAGIASGGKIAKVKMEHIWVEGFIPYGNYRGSMRDQSNKTWIPLDASYKQYNYTQGIDLASAVPFDAQSFVDQVKSSATINETEGYVTNVNSLLIQQTMQDYQTRVQNYITQNYPNATVDDILGKKEIIKFVWGILPASLPYRGAIIGLKYSTIPDSLRHKITFNVIKDAFDDLTGTPINITKSLPEIAGKKVTLSYVPTTSQDENVILSYLPQPHADGSPIQLSEFSTSLPAYLINMKPELRIDGALTATGTTVGLGQGESFKMTFTAPNISTDVVSNEVTAGSYYAIAVNPGRIAEDQVLKLKARVEATKAKLQAQNFVSITKDDLLGDILYSAAMGYFVELDALDFIQAKNQGIVNVRFPSEAIFSFELLANSLMGIPLSVRPDGFVMDVDRNLSILGAVNGDNTKKVEFLLNSGSVGSSLENSVPEQLFSAGGNPVEGISAVKALKIANDQGIPIYVINQSNINSVLPKLQLASGVIMDIKNAVNSGKEVTVSQTNINFYGWIGCGYIIIDPSTGAGTYRISGGMSGSYFPAVALGFISIAMFLTALVVISLIPGMGAIGVVLFAVVAALAIFVGFLFMWAQVATLYGDLAAYKFIACCAQALGFDILAHSFAAALKEFFTGIFEKFLSHVIPVILSGYLGYEIGKCITSIGE